MTISEVCEKYELTPDTLRYYERVGVIPSVNRTSGGIRDYTAEDIRWVASAVFMRKAGVPVEKLIEYVKLFQEGNETFEARRNLLIEVKKNLQEKIDEYQATMNRLDYKISRYDAAIKTGELTWDTEELKRRGIT